MTVPAARTSAGGADWDACLAREDQSGDSQGEALGICTMLQSTRALGARHTAPQTLSSRTATSISSIPPTFTMTEEVRYEIVVDQDLTCAKDVVSGAIDGLWNASATVLVQAASGNGYHHGSDMKYLLTRVCAIWMRASGVC